MTGIWLRLIVILLLILSDGNLISQSGYVYLCQGPQSKKYHYTQNCRGLANCSTNLRKVSLQTAKAEGRTLCGWED